MKLLFLNLLFLNLFLVLGCDYQDDPKLIEAVTVAPIKTNDSSIDAGERFDSLEKNLKQWYDQFVVTVTPKGHPFF